MAPEPDLTHLRLERPAPGVVRLVLDNPDQRNAMSEEMTASWVRAIDALADDRDVRVVVVTGEGSAFCSGGDTSWIASEPDAGVDHLRDRMMPFYRAWLSIRRLEVPTIAAVNGPAIGAGLCLALACDLRYAASGREAGRAVREARHARRAWAGRTCCPTWSARPPPATCCSPGGWSTPTRRCAWAWSRGSSSPTRSTPPCWRPPPASPATRPIATRYTKVALAHGFTDLDSCLQWEALAQPATLTTADLQEGIRASRERAYAGVHRPLRPDVGRGREMERRPPASTPTLAFPLRAWRCPAEAEDRGPHLRPT